MVQKYAILAYSERLPVASESRSEFHEREMDLVADAQHGDRSAFATLYEHYFEPLYRWLYRMAGDAHNAEDLAQEALTKAFASLDSFRIGSNFRAWLYRIAHNNFVNHQRAARKRKQELPTDVAESDAGPPDVAQGRETERWLAECVAKLPEDFRGPLMLRFEQELSFREIAAIFGITEQTARWRVFKARQKLMAEYEKFERPAGDAETGPDHEL